MKEIKLTKGYVAFVDDDDYEEINKYAWIALVCQTNIYAYRALSVSEIIKYKKYTMLMHRQITNAINVYEIDHKDNNGLNNQKTNLRVATKRQNALNRRPQRNSTSKYKGVSFCKNNQKWRAQIFVNGKRQSLGYFTDEVETAKAYDAAAKKCFGNFAYLNFID